MNFIHHLLDAFARMDKEPRLKAHDISLYISLFRIWNKNRFENPIIIYRSELMRMSKIGSKTTYHNSIKKLEECGFIKYIPSNDSLMGSKINMYIFGTSGCPKNVPGVVPKVYPLYKHINYIHNIYSSEESSQNELKENNMKEKKKKAFQVPPIEHIQIYFEQKGHTKTEAEKFFNYYESIGWLVGGKTKMKDWKAAARNWMLNVEKFQNKETNSNSKQETFKNQESKPFSGSGYNEPL